MKAIFRWSAGLCLVVGFGFIGFTVSDLIAPKRSFESGAFALWGAILGAVVAIFLSRRIVP